MKSTVYDVADEAGVAVSTVSRVINGSSRISSETAARVNEAILRLGYEVRHRQRKSMFSFSRTVAVLTMDMLAPQFGTTAATIQQELERLEYSCVVYNTGSDPRIISDCITFLNKAGILSVVCLGAVYEPILLETRIIDKFPEMPFILCNYYYPADNVYSVIIDEVYAGKIAVDHLYQRGHKDILFVKDNNSRSEKNILQGFIDGMSSCGLDVCDGTFFQTTRSLEGGWHAAESIIASGKRFTAVVCNEDFPAVGLIQRFRKLGYSIPDDVAVIGFNNSIIARCCSPLLTTVDKKIDVIGNFVVNNIKLYATGQAAPHQITITPELVVREST